ncbi:hypothetical protein [Sphingomonas faeni]|uniref:hypothetical protein n=1 Tax=Sphingomonas faeni TaxID=185950 RepID=UPI00278ADBF2|nr:hypothetical protein [Sphingomonas faeni]MDQ0839433.1 acetoin utilization deacetylase AcuC-like enzyme [Sphingomonas faeni]
MIDLRGELVSMRSYVPAANKKMPRSGWHADDSIFHFAFQRDDFNLLAALDVPSVIVMEGGYATAALGDNVAAFLRDDAWRCRDTD